MHIQTGHKLTDDVQTLNGINVVSFVAEDGRIMFEVSICKDQKSIEVRSVDCVNISDVVYDNLGMVVQPRAANVIKVSLLPCSAS